MRTIIKYIHEISTNEANPRYIREKKVRDLVNSIISFPKMLEIRPIVVDGDMMVLGGNQRLMALRQIAEMSDEELKSIIRKRKKTESLTKKKVEELEDFWISWKINPIVSVIEAKELTDYEKNEFVIKDNLPYGEWDYDILANVWDDAELLDWGMDLPNFMMSDENEKEKADENTTTTDVFAETEEDEERRSEDITIRDVIYESDNIFEIPNLLIGGQAGKLELPLSPWGANSRLKNDITTYHFYVDDYRFSKLFRDPTNLILSGCKAIAEPNCSLHDQTPIAYGMHSIYRKRWIARYCQDMGIKVYVDLNVAEKFREYNQMGVPKGYNAFMTRGLADQLQSLENDLIQAREISGLDIPNLIVYGGGKKVREFCIANNLLYVQDFINDK